MQEQKTLLDEASLRQPLPADQPLSDEEEEIIMLRKKTLHTLPRDKSLPPVFRELVSTAPDNFKMATFIACCAPLACLATRLRFFYPFDQGPMACLLQTIICSEQSGGKSFARHVENAIMAQQKARDNEQRRLEQEYRELKQKAAKNERLPDPPKTAIICCPVSISIAQLIKRADAPVRLYGCPLTLWTFTEELATATETNRRAFSNLKSIMRTAYDLGSEYGVDYLSENSYSAVVDILYNTMFCTTPSALDEYMDRKAIEGGNVTRTIVYDLGSQLGDEAPEFRRLTPQQLYDIDDTIRRMMADTYDKSGDIMPERYIDMHWLEKTVRTWCAEKNLEAVKSGSTAAGVFFKRSSVSAFRIATLCQYMYGLEEELPVKDDKKDKKRKKSAEKTAVGELFTDGDDLSRDGGQRLAETMSKSKKPQPEGHAQPSAKTRKLVEAIYLAMAEVIFDGMMEKWGKRYEDLCAKRLELNTHDRRDLFSSLPADFSRDLLRETIKRLSLTTPDWVFLSKWNARGLIQKRSKNLFHKL